MKNKILTFVLTAGIMCGCSTWLRYRHDVVVEHLPVGSITIYTNNDYVEYINTNIIYRAYYRADGTIYETKKVTSK